eukprot:Sspe_Gene.88893::Locus_60803_Transcript_1_1_Confidence_1.000_Length_1399::g.88893::m.88893
MRRILRGACGVRGVRGQRRCNTQPTENPERDVAGEALSRIASGKTMGEEEAKRAFREMTFGKDHDNAEGPGKTGVADETTYMRDKAQKWGVDSTPDIGFSHDGMTEAQRQARAAALDTNPFGVSSGTGSSVK